MRPPSVFLACAVSCSNAIPDAGGCASMMAIATIRSSHRWCSDTLEFTC
jgi:hypothetical protein